MDYLKERKPEGGTNRTTTAVTMVTANGNHSDLEGRLGRLEADFKQQAATAAQLRTTVIEKESECSQLRQLISSLETRQRDHEAAVAKALVDLTPAATAQQSAAVKTADEPAAAACSVDIAQQIAEITVSFFSLQAHI